MFYSTISAYVSYLQDNVIRWQICSCYCSTCLRYDVIPNDDIEIEVVTGNNFQCENCCMVAME